MTRKTQQLGHALLLCPPCNCSASTGIHESFDADGSAGNPWGLTFGSGNLDRLGYWERPCYDCARWHEQEDGVPFGSYWPIKKEAEASPEAVGVAG